VHPRTPIEPGGRGLARLALESPLVARGGDRLVLRSYSPVTTIGGGRVLDPAPPRRRAAWPAGLASEDAATRFAALLERPPGGDAEIDRVVRILEEAGLSPPTLGELEQQTGRHDVGAILRLAAQAGKVEAVERERYYSRPALERFTTTLTELGRESAIAPAAL